MSAADFVTRGEFETAVAAFRDELTKNTQSQDQTRIELTTKLDQILQNKVSDAYSAGSVSAKLTHMESEQAAMKTEIKMLSEKFDKAKEAPKDAALRIAQEIIKAVFVAGFGYLLAHFH